MLTDETFCRDTDRRVASASEMVDALPHTTAAIKRLLTRTPHRLSREVQYSVLNCLDSSTIHSSYIEKLLPVVAQFLYTIDSTTACLWMKTGCLLGGGWYQAAETDLRKRLELLLCNAAKTARSAHARGGALHGIEHALNHAPLARGKKLLDVVKEVAITDKALAVRRRAYAMLHRGRWWGGGGLQELHRYARKLGSTLRPPEVPRKPAVQQGR